MVALALLCASEEVLTTSQDAFLKNNMHTLATIFWLSTQKEETKGK